MKQQRYFIEFSAPYSLNYFLIFFFEFPFIFPTWCIFNGIFKILNKMAEAKVFKEDLLVSYAIDRICTLAKDPMFRVRKAIATTIGVVSALVPEDIVTTQLVLFPFFSLYLFLFAFLTYDVYSAASNFPSAHKR